MNTNDYAQLPDAIKARVRAAAAVNSELVQLYWNVGRDILEELTSTPPSRWRSRRTTLSSY